MYGADEFVGDKKLILFSSYLIYQFFLNARKQTRNI